MVAMLNLHCFLVKGLGTWSVPWPQESAITRTGGRSAPESHCRWSKSRPCPRV